MEQATESLNIEELKHNYRIIDQSITAHSVLRDRFNRFSLVLDVVLLSASVLLGATVFLGPEKLSSYSIDPKIATVTKEITSIIVFFISIINLRLNWKQKAENHGRAAAVLSTLKADCRKFLYNADNQDPVEIQKFCSKCALIFDNIAKIPEREFLKLKTKHKNKVAFSKYIDFYPETSYWVLKIRFWFKANFCRKRLKKLNTKEGGCNEPKP